MKKLVFPTRLILNGDKDKKAIFHALLLLLFS